MTFSSRAKNEICRIPLDRHSCALAELSALIHMSGSLQFKGNHKIGFKIITENAAIARRTFSLLKTLFQVQTEVLVRKNRQLKKNNIYSIIVSSDMGAMEVLTRTGIITKDEEGAVDINYGIPPELIQMEECKRAYIRGAFWVGVLFLILKKPIIWSLSPTTKSMPRIFVI